MQIRRVRLNNFRQFWGTQELIFPVEGKKNVTLIHAENGFGKTSILNAVLWCLFKEVTPKFELPDDIVNYEALKEGNNTSRVEVEFEFEKSLYLVQRGYVAESKKAPLTAYRIVSGSHAQLPAPETFVSSVVPQEMAKYFFFDGEAAESFAAARNYKGIATAIRTILGCSLADTAIADLKEVCKNVDREIGDRADDVNIEDLERRLTEKDTELEMAARIREQTVSALAALREQHEEILDRLRTAQAAQEIQKQRDDKQEQLVRVRANIAECRQAIVKWIGQRSLQVVSRRLSRVALDFVDEASLKGKIPSPYNEDFVRGLLGSGLCVCHRPLPSGSAEWTAVADLLKTAGNAEVLRRVVRARARLQLLRRDAGEAPRALGEYRTALARYVADQAKLEQQVEELGKKIEGLPIKEIADRERSRGVIERKIAGENEKLGGIKGHIVQVERDRALIDAELTALARKNKRTAHLFAKRQLALQAIGVLRELLDNYEVQARSTIQGKINEILEVVAHKDFRCVVNESFGIELMLNQRTTPKSGGENQLLSLAFIAALVKFAADRIDANEPILRPGTVAPLVLDAPLGQLDPSYQRSVAEFLPSLAHQVVLLVSGSQGGDRVLEALEPYVAAEYILVQENAGPRGKKEAMQRVIHGRKYDLVLFNQERTMTRIEKVSRT